MKKTGMLLCFLFVCCKPVGARFQKPGETTNNNSKISGQSQRLADATLEIGSRSDFFFTLYNKSFTTKLADLPTPGSVPDDKIPYSGYYYPQQYGGTDLKLRSGQPSPLEKYDSAFNGSTKAHDWERQKHTISSSNPDAGWSGHCNGLGATTQRHTRPLKSVTKNGVTFEPHDIRALLVEVYMGAKYLFLSGGRCERNSPSRPNDTEMGLCDDANPGSFHLSIANWIGKMNHALVFDYATDYQIWNFPIYKYTSTVTSVDKAEAMRQITGSTSSTYRFNPKAVNFSHVKTVVTFSDVLSQSEELTGQTGPVNKPATKTYYYILEMNANGEVIGGEWTTQSKGNHLDFLWVAFEPIQGNGNAEYSNPYISPQEVIRLWAESIGADPDNPPTDITEPGTLSSWGQFSNFDVVLDGTSTGAVFLGKKTKLQINRHPNFSGNVSFEITHNGYPLTTLNGSGSDALRYEFDAVPGLNRLTFTIKKDGRTEKEYVVFHANP